MLSTQLQSGQNNDLSDSGRKIVDPAFLRVSFPAGVSDGASKHLVATVVFCRPLLRNLLRHLCVSILGNIPIIPPMSEVLAEEERNYLSSLFFQYLSVCITELSTQGMYNLGRTQYIEFCLQLHSVKPRFAPS